MSLRDKRIKLILMICGGCLLMFLVFYHTFGKEPKAELKIEDNLTSEIEIEEGVVVEEVVKTILVDIKGAVHYEGVVEAQEGMRVKDVIDKAGGFTEEANVRQVNLAERVEDEMVIYVPTQGEILEVESTELLQKDKGKVSLNKATQAELETLSGIGPAKAATILAYRDENGPFKQLEDLLQVNGIGEKSFEKIKDELTLN